MHDSGAAIPLEAATNLKVKSLYTLMDAAYNSDHIKTYVTDAGKVPIIDPKKPKGGEKIALAPAEKERYKICTTVECPIYIYFKSGSKADSNSLWAIS